MRTTIIITAAAVVGMSTFAQTEPTLRLFGDPYDEFIQAFSISADGKVPGGYYQSLDGTGAGLWTSRTGSVAIPGTFIDPNLESASIGALSADGRFAAVWRTGPAGLISSRWADDGSITELGDLSNEAGTDTLAHFVSSDGRFVTGGSLSPTAYQAFLWKIDTGMTALGVIGSNPDTPPASEGHWLSDDGSRVRGISTTEDGLALFEWSSGGGMQALSDSLPSRSWWVSASPDGTAITGVTWPLSSSDDPTPRPFVWKEGQGFTLLPLIPGPGVHAPYGVSDSGAVVVSNHGLWTPDGGLRPMRDVVSEFFDPPFWLTWSFDPTAISADGNTITGIAFIELPDGWIQVGFLYTFDNPCTADLNRDGRADFFDLADFLRAFNSGDLFADENLDGRLDFFDIQQYLNALAGGCP